MSPGTLYLIGHWRVFPRFVPTQIGESGAERTAGRRILLVDSSAPTREEAYGGD